MTLTPTRTPTRRERLREATVAEIKQAARATLATDGPAGLSLRAIARAMGLSAPALYRYFPSRDDLVAALCADLYDELAGALRTARDAADRRPPAGATTGGARPTAEAPAAEAPAAAGRLLAAARAFRAWAVAHPAEFALMFASPVPYPDSHAGSPHHEAGMRFAEVFLAPFVELWVHRPFPVPAVPPALAGQLEEFGGMLGLALPLGAVAVFLDCWVRLYGSVTLEVFGQLHFCLTDAEPLFEATLADLAARLGLPAGS
ncbi:MAG: TetR/AcrR family transcriptional regulator [Actinomycetota bacterium]